MFSGKTSEKFKGLLKAPLRRRKSRNPNPSPRPTSANVPDTSNVITRAPTGASASPSEVIASTSSLGEPAHASGGGQSLNPQPSTVSMPAKNEAFERAVAVALQKHIDKLSDDDRDAFQSATAVMGKLEELQQDNSRISASHTSRVEKLLQRLQQFLGSVAICIQHSPEISSLVVGGLHCVLTVATHWFIHYYSFMTDINISARLKLY